MSCYQGMPSRWVEELGILPTAWHLREAVLLLAPKTVGATTGSSTVAAGLSEFLLADVEIAH